MDFFDLRGKTALITGSSRGIGFAIARTLAAAGARTIVHGTQAGERLRNAAIHCGPGASWIAADLSHPGGINSLIAQCSDLPDILVLNASVQAYGHLTDFDPDHFQREFAVNVAANLELMSKVLPAMRERGFGRVLAIGSVNALKPAPRLAIYAATKAALANLIRTCAREYAPYDITANILHPGVISTDRNQQALSNPDFSSMIRAQIPAGRFGLPEDCAAIALLLCSAGGAYITGAEIPVDGGMSLG